MIMNSIYGIEILSAGVFVKFVLPAIIIACVAGSLRFSSRTSAPKWR